jgi:hypothetical protein
MLRSFTPTLQRTEGNSGSWRATLFFVYSRKVAFSSIRSQSGPRLCLSGPQLVGSCSPKSAFVLAEKVRVLPLGVLHLNTELPGKLSVHRLQDRAWRDLLRKVTAENVTIERSSKFVNSCVGSLPSHATPAPPSHYSSRHLPVTHHCSRPSIPSHGKPVNVIGFLGRALSPSLLLVHMEPS